LAIEFNKIIKSPNKHFNEAIFRLSATRYGQRLSKEMGTGTKVFSAHQMRFDLSEGFMVTTKAFQIYCI
jgi:hypothetical protein